MRLTGIDLEAMLSHSYQVHLAWHDGEGSRQEFLSSYIFGFSTYDSEMDELFAMRAIEVCKAITERTTFEYIKDRSQYEWFLSMCHMEFFHDRICWGTSIRGAFWDAASSGFMEYETCGLWLGDEQITETIQFTSDEWNSFMHALISFADIKE